MEIRDATPADAEAVRAVHSASITGLGPAGYDREQVAAWAAGCESTDYAEAIAGDGEFLVADVEGTVRGFGSLAFGTPADYRASVDAEVTGVYVHPAVAREGVGTALAAELEDRARERGVDVLGLWASRNAVPFYENRGYERITEHSHEFSSDESTGVTGVVVEMRKEL